MLYYSMIKVTPVASGHISQNYTSVNFVQKNVENVGLVYKRVYLSLFSVTALLVLSFDEA